MRQDTKREPLLSDDAAWEMCHATWLSGFDSWEDPMKATRAFYESLINQGKLMVVKEVSFANGQCEECGTPEQVMSDCELGNFCPGCASKIKK